jgi:hypothetical protein
MTRVSILISKFVFLFRNWCLRCLRPLAICEKDPFYSHILVFTWSYVFSSLYLSFYCRLLRLVTFFFIFEVQHLNMEDIDFLWIVQSIFENRNATYSVCRDSVSPGFLRPRSPNVQCISCCVSTIQASFVGEFGAAGVDSTE